jgi:predicted permease
VNSNLERHGETMSEILQDFRFAFRTLRRSPVLILVVVLSLGIGIGANTAVFSVANALLLRPLPYPDPDRLAILWLRSPGIGIPQDWPSPGEYMDIVSQNQVFEQTALAIGHDSSMTGLAEPQRVQVIEATSSIFPLLGAKVQLGRAFTSTEDIPNGPKVALLSDAFWKSSFGADPHIVGRSIRLGSQPFTVLGVLSPNFLLNREVMPTVGGIEKPDLLLPLPLGADAANRRGDENFNILARVKPGISMRQAQSDIDLIAARIRDKDHRDHTFTVSVVPLLEQVVGNVRTTVLVLLGSVALVLLISCVNVANLLLSRSITRQKEIAVRASLGASRGRLVRQCLAESLTLGFIGGGVGLLFAWSCLFAVRAFDPGNIPRLDTIGIDGSVLFFTFGVSLLSGALFGLAPALRAGSIDLNTALKTEGRASQSEGGLDVARHRLRSLLVISEIALSLILLVGAGLLVRSFTRLIHVAPGFNPENVISMQTALAGPRYRDNELALVNAYQSMEERIARVPGISSLGAVAVLPLTNAVSWGGMKVEGYVPPPNQPEMQFDLRSATPKYFRTMEIPLRSGRMFADSDTTKGEPVALVDQKMADFFWPNQDAVGKRVRFGGTDTVKDPWRRIIGVVGTVKQYGLDIDLRMVVYFPHSQFSNNTMYFVARSTEPSDTVAAAIAHEIHAIDPSAPIFDVKTMPERVALSTSRQRFSMMLLEAFALFALILAVVGVYGVISYQVEQATRDIGIRTALGAQPGDVLTLVLSQGAKLAAIGTVLGLVGALIFSRVMESMLFGISARDPGTFALVVLIVVLVACAASLAPALRASRISPMQALRYE